MSKTNLVIAASILIVLSISCSRFMPGKSSGTAKAPAIDFTTPGKPLDVRVELDKKQTATGTITVAGGRVSLNASDGSKFTLDVPPNAVDADTTITMTAVKSLDGAPLDNNSPTAVQLEPSGLFFKEIATLTIVPGKEMPVDKQIIFGYEGDGKDYHLGVVDPKSKEVKIKLMQFSGAGVGSRSDSAWAANLMIQAADASTRLLQKLGEASQAERRAQFGIDAQNDRAFSDILEQTLAQFYDQVVLKEIAAAELDCKNAEKASQDLILLERTRQLFDVYPGQKIMTPGFSEKLERLNKLRQSCSAPYQIVGGAGSWQTNTRVCDIMKPFTLTGGGFTMEFSGGLSGTFTFSGLFNAKGSGSYTISLPDGIGKPGTMNGGGSGTITGDKVYTGSGTHKYTLTPIEPCG